MKRFIILGIVLLSISCFGQDTLRVMYYNILNFPGDSPERVEDLRKIVHYSKPDVLVVNELLTNEGANLILTDALNKWGITYYEAATFVNGPDTDNMLYYNSEKLGLVSQEQIPTGLRDISEYKLYYKSPGLGTSSDTVYLNMYSLHLKAGSGFFNQRKEEALVLKYHLNGQTNLENTFVGGDFNFYSGNESGCLAIRESGDVQLHDPINSIGDWNNNFSYAAIHTQSTRTSPLADGAGGGLDDRFDLIFTSNDVLNNENGLSYITGSYEALGQDGDRFNGTVNSPFNPTVPDSIADALYFLSDHLPVIMDVKTDYTAGINEGSNNETIYIWFDQNNNELCFNKPVIGELNLYSLSGKKIVEINANDQQRIGLPNLSEGIYIWSLISMDFQLSGKISYSK